MRFFVLLVLFIVIYGYDVGYLKRPTSDERYIEVMEAYSRNLTTNTSIEINIIPCEYNTAGKENVDKCLKELVDKKISLIYAYCDEFIINTDDKYLEENDALIWCVNTFNIGLCKRHHIMGTSLTNSINISMLYIYYNYYSEFYK